MQNLTGDERRSLGKDAEAGTCWCSARFACLLRRGPRGAGPHPMEASGKRSGASISLLLLRESSARKVPLPHDTAACKSPAAPLNSSQCVKTMRTVYRLAADEMRDTAALIVQVLSVRHPP
ncbi:hypothetical protein MVEN_00677700 [Mycena venus]|uniref:Uncharacterized protein n=1 Tax=Mycena venus TaxID=2733690 RepID=A0A8H6YRY0_9AGAR|nr:hypothetical protein MVEN_00677700 [Mycena venus]